MKKTLLALTIAILGIGYAWAEDYAATVRMTYVDYDNPDKAIGEIPAGESALSGYNKISNGSVEPANTGWGCNWITYIQIDASAAEGTILSATLTMDVSGSTDNKRNTKWGIGYNNAKWSADMTYNTADRTITTIGDVQTASIKSSTTFETKTFDITDVLQADDDKLLTILIYETAAAGGYVKNPKVTVSATISTANYMIKYVDTDGNPIKDAVTRIGGVGGAIELKESDIENFFLSDRSKKYIYVNDDAANQVIREDGSTVITITFREAGTFNYSVVSNLETLIASGSDFEGETVSVAFPRYALSKGRLYNKAANNKEYTHSFVLTSDNQTETISYSATANTNIVYFSEAEDIDGMTATDAGNIPVRCSNHWGAYATEQTTITTLSPGIYRICTATFGNEGVTFSFHAGTTEVYTTTTTGYHAETLSSRFMLDEESTVTIAAAGDAEKVIDYIYIEKIETNNQQTNTYPMEKLDRGLMALPAKGGGQLVSWRLLGTDPSNTSFDLMRDGKIIAEDIRNKTNYIDNSGTTTSKYQVVVKVAGKITDTTPAVTPWALPYQTIQLDRPVAGTNEYGTYTYTPNDCSVGDVDGDGVYEIFVQWQPSNKDDNGWRNDMTGNEYIDCYRLDGTKLWRLDMGKNILAGDHHTQFSVFDFNGDGYAEMICKTAPGSIDGKGNYVNQAADEEEIRKADNTEVWRSENGKVIGGQEYLTVFNGMTGEAIHTIFYNPNRDAGYGGAATGTFNWDDRPGRSDYASYGNRGERHLACVAFLDGPNENPSAIMVRGYYTYAYVWAVDFDGEKLTQKWLHGSVSKTKVERTDANGKVESRTHSSNTFGTSDIYTAYGQGNHNISVADVDNDGCDEIIFGGATIDHDGWLLYSTGLGHGDALHVADMIPDRPGYEVFRCCESSPYGIEMHDACTGEKIFHQTAGGDTGRGVAADIMSEYRGFEFWGAKGNNPRESISFEMVANSSPSMNFRIYWDGDLQDELFDGGLNSSTGIASPYIQKWNGSGYDRISVAYNGSQTCNWTKATPCLQADILGDWREELIMWCYDDPSIINIVATDLPSEYRVPTLMHDHNYRLAVAWQNTSYNQPPHLGFYLPDADFSYMETTGITEVKDTHQQQPAGAFNMQGQVVQWPTRQPGIYIVNGKKIMIR